MIGSLRALAVLVVAVASLRAGPGAAVPMSEQMVGDLSFTALFGAPPTADDAVIRLADRGNQDVVPALVLALRYRGAEPATLDAISRLTGTPITDWNDAMLWQEANPDVIPHISYRDLKLAVFERIDPRFMEFLGGWRSRQENLGIRLEEITWGGVRVDGIPSLDNPTLIAAGDADYLLPDDLVFGVAINGDARAYPLRIMGWHEMFNDTIGGVPLALAYCTLCGAGILFETDVEGQDKPLVFGSSGFLYRSNKLMFDRQTNSLWNQFTGEPVSGELRDSGIKLKIRPVVITTWADWQSRNPDTRVLSLDTGFRRDYGSGVVYAEYFASPDLMFPTIVRDESTVQRKDYVFGIREVGAAKAWPLAAFESERVINDTVGGRNVVLVGDAATRTVRAYDRGDLSFGATDRADRLAAVGEVWTVGESALEAQDGRRLARVPGHISYWFAWDGYLGVRSELYQTASGQ